MAAISASVGSGGKNRHDDVQVVQGGLNRFAVARASRLRLATDGAISDAVIGAIKQLQQVGLGLEKPDGRVDPAGRTLTLMANSLTTRNSLKRITVSLREQYLEAYEGERRVFRFPCITGDSGHPTLPGVFKIFRKHEKYRSRTYDADMDFAMFFDHDGKAIHKYHGLFGPTRLLRAVSDQIGSHGCVRLEESDVKRLFAWASYGTPVQIY